jgi:hypothetical protein
MSCRDTDGQTVTDVAAEEAVMIHRLAYAVSESTRLYIESRFMIHSKEPL